MGFFYQILTVILIIAEFYPWLVLTATSTTTTTTTTTLSINKCPESKLPNRLNVPPGAVDTNQRVTFRLRNEFKPCRNERTFTSVLSSQVNVRGDETGLKEISQSYFTADGLLRDGKDYYYPEEYCVSELSGTTVTATVCRPTCKRNRPCLRKCCPINMVMDMEVAGCRPSGGKQWSPVFHSNGTHPLGPEEHQKIRPHYINAPPSCRYSNGSASEEYSSIPLRPVRVNEYQLETIPVRLLKDGSLIYFSFTDTWESIPQDLFCIDGMQNFGELKSYTGSPADQIVFSCVDYYNANANN